MGLGLRPGAKAPDEPPTPYWLRASPRLYSTHPMTLPVSTFKAANNVVVPWRL